MSYAYLRHLAQRGAADIHPVGAAASAALLAALELTPGQCVLEIGCGAGASLARLAAQPGVQALGVDVLPEMLTAARRRLALTSQAAVGLAQARGGALPLAVNSVDRVYMESVIGFQDGPTARQMLAEIYRVLRPGGRLAANEAVWRPEVSAAAVARINAACEADFGLRQAAAEAWTVVEWRALLTETGFRVQAATLLTELPAQPAAPAIGRIWSPSLWWQRWRYRRRLRAHQADGAAIEARLFVADKV